jgi:hypothetical protein
VISIDFGEGETWDGIGQKGLHGFSGIALSGMGGVDEIGAGGLGFRPDADGADQRPVGQADGQPEARLAAPARPGDPGPHIGFRPGGAKRRHHPGNLGLPADARQFGPIRIRKRAQDQPGRPQDQRRNRGQSSFFR